MTSVVDLIRAHEQELVRAWYEEASRAASSRGLDAPEFMNAMPHYIADLGAAGSVDDFSSARRRHLESHISSRLRQGFDLQEVIDEILLLGRCVERIADSAYAEKERPSQADIERLWAELNRTAATVTETFARHMAEDEQEEKRYLRLLRSIASGEQPFGERLKEALDLVRQAVGADTAALLLYRPASHDLVSAATVGIAAIDGFVERLDRSSFAGRVADNVESTAVEDAETTQLTIPDDLRKSGVHSLLGIRLPARHTLRGILYVGLCERKAFTARETQRLETLGEQLTVHLDNARLVGALKERVADLQAERHLRETFVSVLAHDLRGPLSVASMASSLLSNLLADAAPSGTRSAHAKELVHRIDRSLRRADRMLRDLLDANRIHAGMRLPLRLEEDCDLIAIARDTLDELADLYGPRFVLTGSDRVVGTWAPEELRRALWNLAVNAVKYGAAEEPITVHVAMISDRVALSVHNEGRPIPAEVGAHLFEPFARGSAPQRGAPHGWGLGLTLVRGAVESHGGRVEVKSDEVTGTTFTMVLPVDARPYQPARDESAEAPSEGGEPHHGVNLP